MSLTLTLPPLADGATPPSLPDFSQLTIVGASGAGKTRFMDYLIRHAGAAAYPLSPLHAITDARGETPIRRMFAEKYSAMAPDARITNDLDRLMAMLMHDEFLYLLSVKSARLMGNTHAHFEPTRLDRLVEIWQRIFPDNQILRNRGTLQFLTGSGERTVSAIKLSSGERTVLYYVAALLYAPSGALVFIDDPSLFLHPSLIQPVWNAIEGMRPDCRFIYNTSDPEFLSSRTANACIWVKRHDAEKQTWDYTLPTPGSLPDELFLSLMGSRRPVLFIEGDATHSIDSKLYPLIFPRHIVRPVGSCSKVIEATRSFCDLRPIHHLDSHGIVDRDRRTEKEVDYLRKKNIMVPEVAEIENIFLLEEVIAIMARRRRKNIERTLAKVRKAVISMFARQHQEQALQHVRHKMKRELECRADAKVRSIEALERHLHALPDSINMRADYENLMREFGRMIESRDYRAILKVFNHKPMLPESGVIQLLGYHTKDEYITSVLDTLKTDSPDAEALRHAIRACFLAE